MKYYNIEPVADAEIGEGSVIDFNSQPRKIIKIQVYLFSHPESDFIQAYPAFLVSGRLRKAVEDANLTGASFLPCVTNKAEQYDELSESPELPEMWCLEPTGSKGDDFIFHSETQITTSERFIEILAHFSSIGCLFHECNK